MAPSAAVEIDPRLLRQLEEEYETLKNDSSGARGLVPPTRASARLLVPISDDPTLTSRWTTTFAPTPTPQALPRTFPSGSSGACVRRRAPGSSASPSPPPRARSRPRPR